MKAKDFSEGAIIESSCGAGLRMVRIRDDRVVVLSGIEGVSKATEWRDDYHAITVDDLTDSQKTIYHKYFLLDNGSSVGCTCDLQKVIMIHGCQCGWVEKERAK